MKEQFLLGDGWRLLKIAPTPALNPDNVTLLDGWLEIQTMPAMVHDVLLKHGQIPEDYLVGWCEGAIWTDDFDWVYCCEFAQRPDVAAKLVFKGLDTFVDIYLNGECLDSHDDFWQSKTVDVSGKLQERNTLLLHFHNVGEVLKQHPLDTEWEGQMLHCKNLRKPVHDFPPEDICGSNYQGASPWLSPIGVYRDIHLVYPDNEEITTWNLNARLLESNYGEVAIELTGSGDPDGLSVQVLAMDPQGQQFQGVAEVDSSPDGWSANLRLPIEEPLLWWPRGFGEQNLYTVEIVLNKHGNPCDRMEKQVGFRKITMPSPLEFWVNDRRVRLWGGSMDPLQGYTHVWQQDRAKRLFEMVKNAGMNTLRIWGEGHPYPDSFYEEADRQGILIWQEFFMGHGSYPDAPEFREKCVAEAKELVLRLRHHASLLMWCGGNETVMGAQHDGKRVIGEEILTRDYPRLLAKLDPERYYHPNSPYGGTWANDPREGDYHTYNCVWQYPYGEYPNFMSECIRTSPPAPHSLGRMVRGSLWPEGYDGKFRHGDAFPFPENWAMRTHHAAKGHIKTGPYWEYHDADTAEGHCYRFGAAYAKDLRRELEHVRMGSPDGNVPESRRCKGYFSCKLLDTWPKIYCAVIDFFQEGFHPYYATARGLRPLLLCFDQKDSIRLWLCNDSGGDFNGEARLALYHLEEERYLDLGILRQGEASDQFEECISVTMEQGKSGIIYDLADLRFFSKDTVLVAALEDLDGNVLQQSIDYVTEERRLCFKDAVLTVTTEGNQLHITSDRFARCVEITGECEGDPFGWLFSDNYFDLLPNQRKTVTIVDGPPYGTLTVQPHYSSQSVQIEVRSKGGTNEV